MNPIEELSDAFCAALPDSGGVLTPPTAHHPWRLSWGNGENSITIFWDEATGFTGVDVSGISIDQYVHTDSKEVLRAWALEVLTRK